MTIDQNYLLSNENKQILNIRKKLFEIAQLDRLKIDYSSHKGNTNLGLINFIKTMNIEPEIFIRSYLKNIHPFQIMLDKNRSNNHFSCIIDASYRIPLWIEVESTQFHETIISFHELKWYDKKYDNYYNKLENLLIKANDIDFCPIGKYATFPVSMLKGFKNIDLFLYGKKVSEDLILVSKQIYENELINVSNNLIKDFIEQNGSISNYFPRFEKIKELSFTSYGDKLQNEISLLLDLSINHKKYEATMLLDMKISELRKYPDFDILSKYFIEKYKSYEKEYIEYFFVESTAEGDILQEIINKKNINELENNNYIKDEE